MIPAKNFFWPVPLPLHWISPVYEILLLGISKEAMNQVSCKCIQGMCEKS